MAGKKIPINYTARDFQSIKSELVSLAKKYYPNNFKDFSEVGFGSMVMDNVAYVGDVLSFYLDYQANETFFDSAIEFKNVLKLAKQMGYKLRENPSSQGIATFFISIPADSVGLGPDDSYVPVLKSGTVLNTESGASFTLMEDVVFSSPLNDVVVGEVDSETGVPTSFIIRAYGRVVSGAEREVSVTVSGYTKFLRIPLEVSNVAEILSVIDEQGNEYYEVDYLSQDTVYRAVVNRSDTNKYAPSILKPYNVPRRYVVDREDGKVILQFGSGRDASGNISDSITEPTKKVLKLHGKEYFSDESFDPTNIVESDVFGIVPENTRLLIRVRTNAVNDVNAGVDTLTKITNPKFEFKDLTTLNKTLLTNVISSIESTNEEPILGDISLPSVDEFKIRVMNSYASQNRAVTKQDYEALCYKMPPMFGMLKRVRAERDSDSFKRNINLHVISEDEYGKLIQSNSAIKENLKTWLNKNRMINDTIDILDADIVNFGIEFEVVAELTEDKREVLSNAIFEVKQEFSRLRDIGEPLFITDIYKALKKAKGVLDVTEVKVACKNGGLYSDIFIDVPQATSPDGRYVEIPNNSIFEIKYPDNDIKGSIK
jgi:hypothetical protein